MQKQIIKIFFSLAILILLMSFAFVVKAKEVVTPSDFTFIGAFRLPNDLSPSGLTYRYVNGQLKLYSILNTQWNSGSRGHMIEYSVPLDSSLGATEPYPLVSSYQSFGDIYQEKLTEVVDNGSGDGIPLPKIGLEDHPTVPEGLFWDEIDQRMYWAKVVGYNNTSSTSDTTIGYSVLDDASHTGSGIGSWKISPPHSQGGVGNRWSFSFAPIPQSFADAYTGGRRIGVGFGGGTSINWNGPPSIGPALFAINPPNLVTESHMGYMSSLPVELVSHLKGMGEDALRNPALPGLDLREAPYTDTEHWFLEDKSKYGVWIDTPNKHGVIAFAEMGGGNADTVILDTPTPSKTSFALADPGDIRSNDLIRIATDHNPNQNYLFEVRYVESVAGNVITLKTSLTGNPLIGGRVACGTWYDGGGPDTSRIWHPWYIYDPNDLALVAQDPINHPPSAVVPTFNDNVGTPGILYPLQGLTVGATSKYSPKGATFDSVTNRLYLAKSLGSGSNAIYVYQLNGVLINTAAPAAPSGLSVL